MPPVPLRCDGTTAPSPTPSSKRISSAVRSPACCCIRGPRSASPPSCSCPSGLPTGCSCRRWPPQPERRRTRLRQAAIGLVKVEIEGRPRLARRDPGADIGYDRLDAERGDAPREGIAQYPARLALVGNGGNDPRHAGGPTG